MDGVTVSRLWKSYGGHTVLRDLSFHAKPGTPLLIAAPSGGGKTTLLRVLLGLESPDRGDVRTPERWAAVFQEDRLLEHRDALSNLRLVLGRDYHESEARRLLRDLGLDGTDDKPVRDWSGGMRRRLALARALLSPAEALALDEPVAGLDAENRRRCLDAVRRYGAGRTVLLAVHDDGDAPALGADVLVLPVVPRDEAVPPDGSSAG